MNSYTDQIAQISAERANGTPESNNTPDKDVSYDWTGVGFGYQIKDGASLPRSPYEAQELIPQKELDKLKEAIETW